MPESRRPLEVVSSFIAGVLANRVPINRLARLAVQRHVRDVEDGADRGLRFDADAAAKAVDFFGFLHHSKGEWGGQPFSLSPWQTFIVWTLFGWRRADGTRRFRVAYCEVPRKNGKSTFAAGIGLYLLVADREPGAEVYTAATKRDQARIVHGEAVRMVRASPGLRSRIGIYKDNLHVLATSSKFEPLGADEDTLDGLNVSGVLIDELHAHKTRGVWDVLETATGARRQPLQFAITTAGYDRHSICWEQHEYSIKVLEGVFADDSYFAWISALDDEDRERWSDPAVWHRANPNLGVSCKVDDLERKALKAGEAPGALNAFLRLHLNVWTEQETRWLSMDRWNACNERVDAEALRGRRCFWGLDLAKTGDLTALVLAFPADDGTVDVLPFFWIPEERAREKERKDRVPYSVWERQGLIEFTPGESTDYRYVRQRILDLWQTYDVEQLAFDPWNARHLATELVEDDGLPADRIVEFGQTIKNFNEPTQYLETLVRERKLRHGGHAVLTWNASNVTVKTDPSGNIRPVKPGHLESRRIDGVVALIMALGCAILNPAVAQDCKVIVL